MRMARYISIFRIDKAASRNETRFANGYETNKISDL